MSAGAEGCSWVFGYGSLIWRPAFDAAELLPGWIEGWTRRFWQGSTDHRGIPGAPGRVVTVLEMTGSRCWGVAYRLISGTEDQILAALDHREKGGYQRRSVRFRPRDDPGRVIVGTMYIATPLNPNYLGAAPVSAIARQVCGAVGPSGSNVEYVLKLAGALHALGASDRHVIAVAAAVRARLAHQSGRTDPARD